jgi:protein-disulfide isomerase
VDRKQLLVGLVAVAVIAVGVAAYLVFFGGKPETSLAGGTQERANVTLVASDRTLGSPKAPILVVEYAAPTCPHCAHFDTDIFPQLKRTYIDTGKVYYVFRVFPLSQVDVAAESMARCLPKDNYFQFIDLLFRNQSKWDPDGYQIPDVHGALVDMGRIAGMSAEQVDKCIANQAEQQRVTQVGEDAQTRYNINGTPTFLINGQIHGPFEDWQELKDFIEPMLKK